MSPPLIYLSPPDVGDAEREALLAAFESGWIAPLGPSVDAFERSLSELVGGSHVCVTSSGTGALHLALVLKNVGQGDEVLVPTLTFVATANAVRYVGAEPVFVDVDPESWTIDPELVAEYLAERSRAGAKLPKAVITVDLYGHPADYERLREVVQPYGIPILQDAAEALGALYRGQPVGVQGELAVLSFNGNKIITTSGGGALLGRDAALVSRARKLATQAREPASHYEHVELGYNYRLSNLLAALGVAQLQSLTRRVEARRAHRAHYEQALGHLPGFSFLTERPWARSTYWLTTALIDPNVAVAPREKVLGALEAARIEARPTWKPMHLQPLYQGARSLGGTVSRRIFEQGICLPSGSSLKASERHQVCDVIASAAG